MLKTIYELQQDKDKLLEDLITLNKEYKEVTGHDFRN